MKVSRKQKCPHYQPSIKPGGEYICSPKRESGQKSRATIENECLPRVAITLPRVINPIRPTTNTKAKVKEQEHI